jgi:hypothetical protein
LVVRGVFSEEAEADPKRFPVPRLSQVRLMPDRHHGTRRLPTLQATAA